MPSIERLSAAVSGNMPPIYFTFDLWATANFFLDGRNGGTFGSSSSIKMCILFEQLFLSVSACQRISEFTDHWQLAQ